MHRLVLMLITCLLAAPPSGFAQQRAGEGRVALVIGNASYKDAPLANPVNDARAVAKALNEAGFSVKLRTNLSQAQMRRAIREFGDELHANPGVGLFYFAGHGVQISNRNFLIPVGADIQREYEVEDQAVDASAVLSMMQSAKARVNIVILDACRNNPFVRDFRSTINGLAPMQAPTGTLVAFSTAPGQTAIDGTGQYGLYTEHLVENLTVPGLKIEDVFKNVRIGVQRASGGRQVPWENTSLTGDFYFRGPAAVAVAAAVVSQAAPAAVSQDAIEKAVLQALRRREGELATAQAARSVRESGAAQAELESLRKELAELRAARDAERAPAAQSPADPPERLAAAVPGIARTQPEINVGGRIDRPQVRVGDRWTHRVTDRYTGFTSVVETEVVRMTENRIYTKETRSAPGPTGLPAKSESIDVWDRDWNQLRQGEVDFNPRYPSLRFPLESGRQWSGTMTRDGMPATVTLTYDLDSRAAGWERVTVPAGTFDAIRIVARGRYRASGTQRGDGSIEETLWFAPAIGQLVKKEMHHLASWGGGTLTQGAANAQLYERWELLEYRPN